MNIVFFGSGGFALKSLEALAGSPHKVILALTHPDRPKGRHLETQTPELKVLADKLGIPAYQPEDPNSQQSIDFLRQFPADLFVVVSYGHILKEALLALPKLYPLNIHASLLPKYRGSSPINWAIINGDKETGISIIRMDRFMDSGDILSRRDIRIEEDDNYETLKAKLEVLAARTIIEAIDLISEKKAVFLKQNSAQASFAPKLKKSDGLIHWEKEADCISRQIKGLVPWPGAFTYYQGRLIKLWQAKASTTAENTTVHPGEILETGKNGIMVACGKGSLVIQELQPESGKRLSAETFINGYRLAAGQNFGLTKISADLDI